MGLFSGLRGKGAEALGSQTTTLLRTFIAAAALSLPALASASVVVHTSAFISTPIAGTDFEAVGSSPLLVNTPHTVGGLTIQYVWPTTPSPDAATAGPDWHMWYAIDYKGYTSISLADGSAFNQIQFDAASGFGPTGSQNLQYALLYHGLQVATGATGTLDAIGAAARVFGFSGVTFDEVRLRNDHNLTTYQDSSSSDALALDNIQLGRIVTSVPELSTWLMMVMGLGMVGTTMRHRSVQLTKVSISTGWRHVAP